MTKDQQDDIVAAAMRKHAEGGLMDGRQLIAMAVDLHAGFVAAGATSAEIAVFLRSFVDQVRQGSTIPEAEHADFFRRMFDAFGFDIIAARDSQGQTTYSPKTRLLH